MKQFTQLTIHPGPYILKLLSGSVLAQCLTGFNAIKCLMITLVKTVHEPHILHGHKNHQQLFSSLIRSKPHHKKKSFKT